MNGFTFRLLVAGFLSAATFVGALAYGVSGQTRDVDQRQAWTVGSADGGTVYR